MKRSEILQFQQTVWEYYQHHVRDLPWRQPEVDRSFDPYKILVSEIMLQQTQVARVIPKYLAFLQLFPDLQTLADAPLSVVLSAWSGLGYNRRAKYLHDAAKHLVAKETPWKIGDMAACKGIGPNTTAAVMAYAYNEPVVFIETNIRTVYIHHFFAIGSYPIADRQILELVSQTLDRHNAREWYWALMDYGSYLKATSRNAAQRSRHYNKQTSFEGSSRQIRGQILRLLTSGPLSVTQFRQHILDVRLVEILLGLETEKLITKLGRLYMLAD